LTDGLLLREMAGDFLLRQYSCMEYPGWEMSIPDQTRADIFLKELADFEKKGSFPDLTAIQGVDSRSNMFSSVQVAPGYRVTFYNQPNFQGVSGQFSAGSYPYVGDYWNDQVSSFRIDRA
jgi:hypothetical protein